VGPPIPISLQVVSFIAGVIWSPESCTLHVVACRLQLTTSSFIVIGVLISDKQLSRAIKHSPVTVDRLHGERTLRQCSGYGIGLVI